MLEIRCEYNKEWLDCWTTVSLDELFIHLRPYPETGPLSTLPVAKNGGLSTAKVGGSPQVFREDGHRLQTYRSVLYEPETLQKSSDFPSVFSHLQNENKHVAKMKGDTDAEEFTKMKNKQNQKNTT